MGLGQRRSQAPEYPVRSLRRSSWQGLSNHHSPALHWSDANRRLQADSFWVVLVADFPTIRAFLILSWIWSFLF